MWIFYTTLVLFILLTGYFFVFPLYKKRPVLIKSGGLVVYSAVLVFALYPLFEVWIFVAIIMILFFSFLLKPWFVYGATGVMISDALEKAAFATRTPIEKLTNKYKIGGGMKVKLYSLARKINIISFTTASGSKKAELTVVVFKKFIQNYFV